MNVLISIAMESNNYKKRVHAYLTSRSYFKKLVDKGVLTLDSFNKINARLLAKYDLSERSIYNRN